MSTYLSHTLLLNRQNHAIARHHGQIGVVHQRCLKPHAEINRQCPHGSKLAIIHRRKSICRSAEEVLELSEESVEEVLQVNQTIPRVVGQSACTVHMR